MIADVLILVVVAACVVYWYSRRAKPGKTSSLPPPVVQSVPPPPSQAEREKDPFLQEVASQKVRTDAVVAAASKQHQRELAARRT